MKQQMLLLVLLSNRRGRERQEPRGHAFPHFAAERWGNSRRRCLIAAMVNELLQRVLQDSIEFSDRVARFSGPNNLP